MNTKPIIVEYLIIIKQEDTFCDNDKVFLKFLCVDSSISISEEDKTITLNSKKTSKFTVSYSLESDLVISKKERYFKLTLSSKEEKLNEYTELTTLLEKLISKLNPEVSINILWNDIARKYAIEGYGLINEVENLLRRLITNFMLINVGYEWHKYYIPTSVETRDNNIKENYSNYLHQTYFSDLKTILFEGQRDLKLRNIGAVQSFVQRCIADSKTQIPVEDLKGVIATSLWEKYFSKGCNYKKEALEDDLDKLNTLRNQIAHNRHINVETLNKIRSLSTKIIKTLNLAIEDLPNTVLTTEEQKFQMDTEKNRILGNDSTLQGYLVEASVFEWYKLIYQTQNVQLVGMPNDFGVDIIVRLNTTQRIGINVKSCSIIELKHIRNMIVHGEAMRRYIPQDIQKYKEFHLTIVLRDYMKGIDISEFSELILLLKNINSKIRLILGFLNENNTFTQIL